MHKRRPLNFIFGGKIFRRYAIKSLSPQNVDLAGFLNSTDISAKQPKQYWGYF